MIKLCNLLLLIVLLSSCANKKQESTSFYCKACNQIDSLIPLLESSDFDEIYRMNVKISKLAEKCGEYVLQIKKAHQFSNFKLAVSDDFKIGVISWNVGRCIAEHVKFWSYNNEIFSYKYVEEDISKENVHSSKYFKIESIKNSDGEKIYLLESYGMPAGGLHLKSLEAYSLKKTLESEKIFPDDNSQVGYVIENSDRNKFDLTLDILNKEKEVVLPIYSTGGVFTSEYAELEFVGHNYLLKEKYRKKEFKDYFFKVELPYRFKTATFSGPEIISFENEKCYSKSGLNSEMIERLILDKTARRLNKNLSLTWLKENLSDFDADWWYQVSPLFYYENDSMTNYVVRLHENEAGNSYGIDTLCLLKYREDSLIEIVSVTVDGVERRLDSYEKENSSYWLETLYKRSAEVFISNNNIQSKVYSIIENNGSDCDFIKDTCYSLNSLDTTEVKDYSL